MNAPGPEPSAPHGAHGRPLTRAEKWAVYKGSPYFPATVLVFILAAAWAVVSCTVFWVWRHRHPGGRDHMPRHAATAT